MCGHTMLGDRHREGWSVCPLWWSQEPCPVSVKAQEAGRGRGGCSPLDTAAPPDLPGRRGMKDKQKAPGELHSVPDVSRDLPERSQPLSGSCSGEKGGSRASGHLCIMCHVVPNGKLLLGRE